MVTVRRLTDLKTESEDRTSLDRLQDTLRSGRVVEERKAHMTDVGGGPHPG